jgi:hypothetical protein
MAKTAQNAGRGSLTSVPPLPACAGLDARCTGRRMTTCKARQVWPVEDHDLQQAALCGRQGLLIDERAPSRA